MDLSQSSPGGFLPRRSYPALNHISLAPLAPRFPVDDDEEENNNESTDYFTARNNNEDNQPSYIAHEVTARTSYLSSFSVPGTPGVLSQSRSGSRVRHHQRSKSSSHMNLSDTNLHGQGAAEVRPFHHGGDRDQRAAKQLSGSSRRRPPQLSSGGGSRLDTEWMLRAGIALASSTREEKGQSWLAKRESSTSLVSEGDYDVEGLEQHGRVGKRKTKSGRSTPAMHSRRGSRNVSRRNSRMDLAMTSLDTTTTAAAAAAVKQGGCNNNAHGTHSAGASPAEDVRQFVPDFVDEHVRAEMAILQQDEEGYYSSSSDEFLDSEDDMDDMDEQELQRLTRERGFGLGSWIDRMVEWTLFGVEDWPLFWSNDPVERPSKHVEIAAEKALTIEEREDSASSPGVADNDDDASVVSEWEVSSVTEKPGEHGGWEDAGWLFRTMKRVLI
ncbi:DUF3984 domain-containing protein [Aspergillus tanneri]|uniref:Uncharacterized protein n=1 Tax=Aspergillus tanneri TaxID=1220188 RepID=A0A5M9MW56_9EURO|nr:uncharacterized protein ATNIH1004_005018 [Aspergillus tanneri]KAA8649123.1 hypothetical protein ATNIH1004_005018 [Aspergillus tanneri]